MTIWEYGDFTATAGTFEWRGPDGQVTNLDAAVGEVTTLNRLGAEGWEAYAVTEAVGRMGYRSYFLKRPS